MRNNKSTIFWVGGVIIILLILFFYPRMKSGNSLVAYSVPCLVPNVPLTQHIHPRLTILVDGREETIPANIGIAECERAVHTHAEDAAAGIIHIESQDRQQYTLGNFFEVWHKTMEREGYTVKITADGEEVQNPADLIFKDGQQIVITYTSIK